MPRPSDILTSQRQRILEIARSHGAVGVWVFGSTARGDDTSDSDLDLLVELAPGRTLIDLGAMWSELSETLGCAVDITTVGSLPHEHRESLQGFPL